MTPNPDTVRRPKLTPAQLARKTALLREGLSISDVARRAEVSRQTVWEVVMDRTTSRRVQEIFADMVGEPVERLFPSTAA